MGKALISKQGTLASEVWVKLVASQTHAPTTKIHKMHVKSVNSPKIDC